MEEVVICERCNGYGKYESRSYDRNYELQDNKCERCDGVGKLIKITTVTFKKFSNDKDYTLKRI